MKEFKNYQAIYNVLCGSSNEQLFELYKLYTGHEDIKFEGPHGMYIDWAIEVTAAMAESDGLTDEEMEIALNW